MITGAAILGAVVLGAASTCGGWLFNKATHLRSLTKRVDTLEAIVKAN